MEENREKTYVEDIDRSVYDIKNDEKDAYVGAHIGDNFIQQQRPPLWSSFPEKKRIRLGWSFSGFDLCRSTTV